MIVSSNTTSLSFHQTQPSWLTDRFISSFLHDAQVRRNADPLLFRAPVLSLSTTFQITHADANRTSTQRSNRQQTSGTCIEEGQISFWRRLARRLSGDERK